MWTSVELKSREAGGARLISSAEGEGVPDVSEAIVAVRSDWNSMAQGPG